MPSVFLTARWEKLAMANYEIDPAVLLPYVPYKTELDLWKGRCYISLVGFLFKDTRVLGFRIPGHVHFEEVNLRFYVRYKSAGEWKRGVVFVKEIVPRPAISFVARRLYNEPYVSMPMRHHFVKNYDSQSLKYEWQYKGVWNCIQLTTALQAVSIPPDSEAGFITEHYWGYTAQSSNRTSEYQVEHPVWDMWPVQRYDIHCQAAELYGPAFGEAMQAAPRSVFVATGSEVVVRKGSIIK